MKTMITTKDCENLSYSIIGYVLDGLLEWVEENKKTTEENASYRSLFAARETTRAKTAYGYELTITYKKTQLSVTVTRLEKVDYRKYGKKTKNILK